MRGVPVDAYPAVIARQIDSETSRDTVELDEILAGHGQWKPGGVDMATSGRRGALQIGKPAVRRQRLKRLERRAGIGPRVPKHARPKQGFGPRAAKV